MCVLVSRLFTISSSFLMYRGASAWRSTEHHVLICYTMYNVHCTCTIYVVHRTTYTDYISRLSVYCTVYIVWCTLYGVYCTVYNVRCTMYGVHCMVCIVRYTLYTVHCTVYVVHRTLYTRVDHFFSELTGSLSI